MQIRERESFICGVILVLLGLLPIATKDSSIWVRNSESFGRAITAPNAIPIGVFVVIIGMYLILTSIKRK